MITIGVDAHKREHVGLALDDQGRELGHWRGPNSAAGWRAMLQWATELGGPRVWGIEGAWGYGRGLAQYLVSTEDSVHDINARWTAAGRLSARKPGKSDRLDARSVALLVQREAPALPQVRPEDVTAVLDLLTTEREGALAEATRLRNQIHALLLQLDPEYRSRFPTLRSKRALEALEHYVAPTPGVVQKHRAAAVRRLAIRLRLALAQVDELAQAIEEHAGTPAFAPLTRLCGVSVLTAAALAGILGPGHRFANDAQLAAYAGVAPLEASSAGLVRHRLNRGGNRRLNSLFYRIALTQAHHLPQAREYLARRVSEGKTRREARRALVRFIARSVWRLWQECETSPAGLDVTRAA